MKPHSPASEPSPSLTPLLVLLGLAGYLALFFTSDMPTLRAATGKPFPRMALVFWLTPTDLIESWCGSPAAFSLADRLPVLALAAAVLAVAACVGWLLLALLRADRGLTRLENFVFSTAVGLNAASTYVLAVGLCGHLGWRWLFVAPALVAVGATAWLLWRRGRAPRDDHGGPTHPVRPGNDPAWSGLRWLWPALALPFVLLVFLGGVLPPVDFDVREYHLQVPKEFYQEGRIGALPHNVYGNMPLGAEMLSLLAMVLAGDWWWGALAGKTVIAAFAPLTALGLWAAGRRLFSPTAGAIAALVYLSVPWIIQVSTNGLVEGAWACYVFLAVYALALWWDTSRPLSLWERVRVRGPDGPPAASERQLPADALAEESGPHPSPLPKGEGGSGRSLPKGEGERGCSLPNGEGKGGCSALLVLAGYLAGGAVSCKYPSVLFVVLPLMLWVLWAGSRSWRRPAWKPAGAFLLAAAVGCGLWFGKNWVLTGNPTYPLFYSVFDGKNWSAEKDRQWNRVHRPHDFSAAALGRDLARVGLTSEWLSPLVIPLAVLAFLRRSSRRLAVVLAVYFVYVVACWWLLTHRIDRFWIPALPLVALMAGAGATWSGDRRWRAMLVGIVALLTAWDFLVASSVGSGSPSYFVPLQQLRREAEQWDPWHRYFNQHAAGGKLLLVGDAQPFDLRMPVLYSTCFDDSPFERIVKGRSPQEIRASLTREGITHVYVHWGEIVRYRATYGFTSFVEPAVFERLVRQGVLAPLSPIEGHPGRGYRVVGSAGQ